MSRVFQLLALAAIVLLGSFSAQAEKTVEVSAYDRVTTNMIRNATFMEITPEFTDLYIIETQDKGREIVIYCNTVYCYKHRGQAILV